MPTRPHGHGGAGGEPEPPARSRAKGAHVGSVREGGQAVAEVVKAGRVNDGGAARATPPGGARPQTEDLITRKTGTPGGAPDGNPTRVGPKDDVETRRSLEMENSGAAVFARAGYRIKQNPTREEVARSRHETGDTGDPEKNPDYLIEGRVFDCYSPTNPLKSARGIWGEVEEKIVVKRQAQRAVVNLEDWRGDMSALRRQFGGWPIPGLKEVKIIMPDGDIVQIDIPSD